jgi:hypothetical protein
VKTSSYRPWPKGWFLSAGFCDSQMPKITKIELSESLSVCQASAIRATDPLITPTQYLITNSKRLIKMDIQPALSDRFESDLSINIFN